ncbi:hypothetical protein ACQPZ2_00995 [Nocardia pseudovaccinii]|uniref:hypothetical protein n=1 Tax=Nocardia pseudovaccinii TaxID=189540 RepID=UPI003D91CB9E
MDLLHDTMAALLSTSTSGKSILLSRLAPETDQARYVQVLTMPRSKGMEFFRVILTGVSEPNMPAARTLRGILEEKLAFWSSRGNIPNRSQTASDPIGYREWPFDDGSIPRGARKARISYR